MSTDADDAPDPCGPSIAEALRRSSAAAAELVRQHLEFNDEVLPTVLLGEVGDWFTDAVHRERPDVDDARRVVQAIATLYRDGGDEMQNTIATGFLEALPEPDAPDRAVVNELPPDLGDKLRRMEAWVPPTS